MFTNFYQPHFLAKSPQKARKTTSLGIQSLIWLLGILCLSFTANAQVNVGDYVFIDANRNGIQDDGIENGLNGISVELWDAGADGVEGTDDIQIGTILSDDDGFGNPGYYLFTGVTPGLYFLKFPKNSDSKHYLSLSNVTGDTQDSDPNILTGTTSVFRVAAANITDVDAGYALLTPFPNSVCQAQFILSNKVATAYKTATQKNFILNIPKFNSALGELLRVDVETRTVFKHTYKFENLDLDSARLIDYLAIDSAWVNGIGINPPRLREETFILDDYLLAENSSTPLGDPDFTGTDYVQGDTIFEILRKDSSMIDAANLTSFSGAGNVPYTFNTRSATILSGGSNLFQSIARTVKFEIYVRYVYTKPVCGSIGDYVWNDTNKNGVQDPNEVGLAGITVTLYDGIGRPVSTTITDALGAYLFQNIQPGDYSIGFTLPTDYTFSPTGGTANPNLDSNPDVTTGLTSTFTLDTLQNITNIDAGMYFVPPIIGNLGNRVWYDLNNDGDQDDLEAGVYNVTVSLFDAATKTLLQSTLTDNNGEYYFRNLAAGDYYVKITPPLGYTYTTLDAGANDAFDSDIDPATGRTIDINLADGETDYSWDIGIVQVPGTSASVGDFVWNDLNQDGVQDADEPGIAGVVVNLFDGAGNPIATTTTDAFGKYLFDNVQIDLGGGVLRTNYYMEFTLPAGFDVSPLNAGGSSDLDSDISPSGKTAIFILNVGNKKTDIDAGLFNTIPAGTAQLGNYVWLDLDKDGIQDPNEAGVAGITVILYDGTNTELARTTTNSEGGYLFTELDAGIYSVKFENLPFQTRFTLQNQGGDFTADSDVDPTTGFTSLITLAVGDVNLSIDAGLIKALDEGGNGSIGDFVWEDVNQDGVQNNGEPGIAGVTVTIRNVSNTFSATTTTDGAGKYIFNNLLPDDYILDFTNLPTGFVFTTQNLGGEPTKDSDVDPTGETTVITLLAGQSRLDIDAGAIKADPLLGSVGDYVWYDTDNDGIQDGTELGVEGVTVTLFTESNDIVATTQTNSLGRYLFTQLPTGKYKILFSNLPDGYTFTTQNDPLATVNNDSDASTDPTTLGQVDVFTLNPGVNNLSFDAGLVSLRAAIGNFVWNDIDRDGLQDTNEPGISGITVILRDNVGNQVSSTVTAANGTYYFTNLLPGQYQLEFTDLPQGSTFTKADAVSNTQDARDSDVDPASGIIPAFTLAAGDRNFTFDAGIIAPLPASVKGIVWYDVTNIGQRDPSETRVQGVTVTLVDAANRPIATTVTDANGVYTFTNVPPGTYTVIFTTFPAGATLTTPNVGSDNTDSDITLLSAPNTPIVATGGSITVNSGDNLKGPDGGILPPAALKGRAWTDGNQNGQRELLLGETGIPQVTVFLLDEGGAIIATTVTGEGGFYEFLGLTPGNRYEVQFDSLTDRAWTLKKVGDAATDSDVNTSGTANAGRTGLLSPLAPNETRPNIDAGYLPTGAVFPIEILTFTGYLKGKVANLKWKSVQEVNSSKFILERSFDGFKTKSPVGEVKAAGNSTAIRDYSFADNGLKGLNVEKVWYRLKMVDIGGTFEYSKEIVELRLDEEVGNIFMEFYPNPAQGQLFLNYQLFDTQYGDIILSNSMGQVVYQQAITANKDLKNTSIDISNMAGGMYFLQISTEDSKVIKRVIIE